MITPESYQNILKYHAATEPSVIEVGFQSMPGEFRGRVSRDHREEGRLRENLAREEGLGYEPVLGPPAVRTAGVGPQRRGLAIDGRIKDLCCLTTKKGHWCTRVFLD